MIVQDLAPGESDRCLRIALSVHDEDSGQCPLCHTETWEFSPRLHVWSQPSCKCTHTSRQKQPCAAGEMYISKMITGKPEPKNTGVFHKYI